MAEQPQRLNPDLTRRRFLQGTAFAGVAAFLAACSGTGESGAPSAAGSANIPTPPPAPSASASVAPTPKPSPTGPLHWAQWPAYIDLSGKAYDTGVYTPGSSPTLEQFKKQYKVDVNYEDWLAAKIISKGWAEKLDQGDVPNCTANLRDALKGQVWDPTNDYHYPWQSGMTGIGYNKASLKKVGKAEPKSLADLYALPPERITFLNEKRDTFGLGLLKLAIDPDPTKITADDLQKVHDDIKPLADAGLRFVGNEYLQDFASKKTWAAMTWSGDLASSGAEDDVWVAPTEGAMIWTDNLVIPKGAANKYTAELMMNFCYDPKIAAQIANYVYYVSPVKGADVEIAKLDPEAAKNPLLFPPADVVAKQKNFQFLSDELEAKMNELYSDLSGT